MKMRLVFKKVFLVLVASLIALSTVIPVMPLSRQIDRLVGEPRHAYADNTTIIGWAGIGSNSTAFSNAFAARGGIYGSYTASAGDNVTSIHVYGREVAGSGSADYAIYTYNGTSPETRVAPAVSITMNSTTTQWWSVDTNFALTGGVTYVIAMGNWTDVGGNYRVFHNNVVSGDRSTGAVGALPATWTQTGTNTERFSMYADVTNTPAGVSAPTVTTTANATGITFEAATIAGNITNVGGENADWRGFEWDTDTGAPYANNWTEAGNFGTGNYSHPLSGLTANTTYYFRAIAHNSGGEGVGPESQFQTDPQAPAPAAPTNLVATKSVSTNVTLTWTQSVNATGYTIWRNGANFTTVGAVGTYTDITASQPTLNGGSANASDGNSGWHDWSSPTAVNITGAFGGGVGHGGAYSNSGVYFAGAFSSGGLQIFKKDSTGDNYTRLSNPTYHPSEGFSVAWWPDDSKLIMSGDSGTASEGYLWAFERSGDVFTLMNNAFDSGNVTYGGGALGLAVNPNGLFLAYGDGASTNITIYAWNGTGFKTAFNIASAFKVKGMAWTHAGDILTVTYDTGTPFVASFEWDGETFTALSAMPGAGANGYAGDYSYDDSIFAMSRLDATGAAWYSRNVSSNAFTKLSNPANVPSSGFSYGSSIAPSADYIAWGATDNNSLYIHSRSGTNLTYTENISSVQNMQGNNPLWSPDQQYLALVSRATPYLKFLKTSGNLIANSTNVTLIASNISATPTVYTYEVSAFNISGNSANSTADTGWVGLEPFTFQWFESAGDADAAYSAISGANTTAFRYTGGTTTGNYYKLQSTAGNVSANSTPDRGYLAGGGIVAPTVTSQAASAITSTTATANGNITATGGENATSVFVQYGLATGNYTANFTTAGNFGAGAFTIAMSGLTANTTYFARVGAANSAGPGYGGEISFTTSAATTPEIYSPSSSVSVTKDGVTTENISFNLSSLGSANSTDAWVDWGLTSSYGNSSSNTSYNTSGVKTVSLSTNLTPGQVYHYRIGATNTDGTTFTSDQTFTLTMPSVSTGTMTDAFSGKPFNVATLHGTVGSMGVASSVYYHWEYGPDGSYGQSTPEVTVSSPGSFITTVSGYPDTWLSGSFHARFVVRVGSISVYGADQSFAFPSSQNGLGSAIAILLLLSLGIGALVDASRNKK